MGLKAKVKKFIKISLSSKITKQHRFNTKTHHKKIKDKYIMKIKTTSKRTMKVGEIEVSRCVESQLARTLALENSDQALQISDLVS